MSTRTFDAEVHIDADDSQGTTSSGYHNLIVADDTIRLITPWGSPDGGATGAVGEIRWGSQTVLGITTYYMYLCTATDTWKRSAFASF